MKKIFIFSIVAATALFADSDIEEIKKLIMEQQKTIQALQERVRELETQKTNNAAATTDITASASQTTSETVSQKPRVPDSSTIADAGSIAAPVAAISQNSYVPDSDVASDTMLPDTTEAPSATFNQKSYLPDIALILDGSAVGRNMNNSTYETYYYPGFTTYSPVEEAEIPFNKDRGFNFNYAELSMFSTVGPYFDATAIFHLSSNEFETEEAYISTRAMPYNLSVKAGKFRSDFGRINAIHQHAWKFTSQPIVYEAMLGPEGINDAGIQLQWVLPTDTYLLAGIEAMQGNNDVSFGDTEKNNLYIGYLKGSIDLTDSTTALGGLSLAHGKNEFGRDTDLYGADLTVKTFFDSYSSLLWQSELLYRDRHTDTGKANQAGYYTQLFYQYNQNWSAGIRYGSLYKNLKRQPDNLDRYTAVMEYRPFEFTKFRLQYTYDRSRAFGIDDERRNTSELLLEFTVEAGAHGAHAF